jgi:hypothetical protein
MRDPRDAACTARRLAAGLESGRVEGLVQTKTDSKSVHTAKAIGSIEQYDRPLMKQFSEHVGKLALEYRGSPFPTGGDPQPRVR